MADDWQIPEIDENAYHYKFVHSPTKGLLLWPCNKDGGPSHQRMCMRQWNDSSHDVHINSNRYLFGEAKGDDNGLRIYHEHTPQVAMNAIDDVVKELKKLHPDTPIVSSYEHRLAAKLERMAKTAADENLPDHQAYSMISEHAEHPAHYGHHAWFNFPNTNETFVNWNGHHAELADQFGLNRRLASRTEPIYQGHVKMWNQPDEEMPDLDPIRSAGALFWTPTNRMWGASRVPMHIDEYLRSNWPEYIEPTRNARTALHQQWRQDYHYREAKGKKHCGSCDAFKKGILSDKCKMFNDSSVESDHVCDEWTTHFKKSKTAMALNPDVVERLGTLYHYTRPDQVASILQYGLKPWDETGVRGPASQGYWKPRPGCVYLALVDYVEGRNDEGMIVLAVDTSQLDSTKFTADEDTFNQPRGEHPDDEQLQNMIGEGWENALTNEPPAGHWDETKPTLGEWAEQHADFMNHPDVGQASLAINQTIAYQGSVPPSAISFGSTYDGEMYAAWQRGDEHFAKTATGMPDPSGLGGESDWATPQHHEHYDMHQVPDPLHTMRSDAPLCHCGVFVGPHERTPYCEPAVGTQIVSKTATMTRNQYLQLAAQLPEDRSEVVHQFPDGWSIRKLNTYGDERREGWLMNNCLRPPPSEDWIPSYATPEEMEGRDWTNDHEHFEELLGSPVDFQDYLTDKALAYPDDEIVSQNPQNNWNYHSLRDPDNLPRATFTVQDHRLGPYPSLGSKIYEVMGRHNGALSEDKANRIQQFATEHGHGIDPGEMEVNHYAANQWNENQTNDGWQIPKVPSEWSTLNDEGDICPHCGEQMEAHDYCKKCHRRVRTSAASKQKWVYLNGDVLQHEHWPEAAKYLAMRQGFDTYEQNRLSNMIAAGAYPADSPHDIACGYYGKFGPEVIASNVDRNAVWDAVHDSFNQAA